MEIYLCTIKELINSFRKIFFAKDYSSLFSNINIITTFPT